jgi:hypothetical protein
MLLDFPLGKPVRALSLDNEPVVVFKIPDDAPEGAGLTSAAVFRNGSWGPADLAAAAVDGRSIPWKDMEDWVAKLS